MIYGGMSEDLGENLGDSFRCVTVAERIPCVTHGGVDTGILQEPGGFIDDGGEIGAYQAGRAA